MKPSPLEFPCEFPIKVMGRAGTDFVAEVRAIVERFTGPLADTQMRVRTSGDGNFLAVTFLPTATSQAQLDDIYRALTACKSVVMAL
jgi:putative lipoic acid-binding regulatory protein